VSERLARSLDYGAILESIAELAVPSIADWCLVTIIDDDGTVDRVAVAHADPEAAGLAAEVAGMITRRDEPAAALIPESGEPYLHSNAEIDSAGDGGSVANRALLRKLEARSAIVVPLLAHGRSFGAITLVTAESKRHYGEEDLALARDLARRAAGAVENARLYADLRRLARAERARAAELEGVLQAMGEPVLVFDPDGRIRLANQAAVAFFGEAMVHDFAWVIGRFEDPTHASPVLGFGEQQGPVELRMTRSETWVEVTAYPVRVGDDADAGPGGSDSGDALEPASSTILVVRDVTALRQAQRLREAFISVLSHELRTPITTIYGGTRVLARPGLAEQTRREVSEDITAEAERLHRLVEDLLVLTRAERGRIEIGGDPVLLQHLLPGVVRSEAARWPDNRFEVDLAPSMPTVSGEETYVEQVVRNLVGNAAKYSSPASLIEIRTEVLEEEVQVRILDEGPGFAAEERPRLFELFYRSPTTSATSSGAGIGLFVCRALVEAMGGRIWAHPRPAGGAEFGFALPRFDEEEI
jgi:signal transduction histidine kinase